MSLVTKDPMFDIVLGLCGANAAEYCGQKKVVEAIEKDPVSLITMARHHKVFPHVYCAIKKSNRFSDKLINKLHPSYKANTHLMLNFTADLVRLAELFDENGIRHISIKGPILARDLFGSVTKRQSSDLDVWISPKDVERADSVMAEHGYKRIMPNIDLSPKQRRHFFRWCYNQVYRSPKGVTIEIHWRLSFDRAGILLDFDKACSNCEKAMVLLPAPDSPTKATVLLAFISRVTSLSAAFLAPLYLYETPSKITFSFTRN